MALKLTKDFCLWIVPPSDGRVRKLRFTASRLLGAAAVAILCSGLVAYVVGDYARVQLLRATTYFSLQRVSFERDDLRDQNSSLETKVEALKQTNARVLNYEQNLKQRISQIAGAIGELGKLGVLETKAPGSNDSKTEDALGGLEIECDVLGDSRCDLESIGSDFDPSETAALFEPEEELILKEDAGVIETLDYYLGLIRAMPFGMPSKGRLSSGFGMRRSPFTGRKQLHQGMDIALPMRTKILAPGDGVVTAVKRTRTYGLMIDVQHNPRVMTRYGHLSHSLVKEGSRISKGQKLALSGSTGRSTGPHLHYEIRVKNRPVNPQRFLKISERLKSLLQ